MKLSCSVTSEEFNVILTKEEISDLEKKVLKGEVKVYDREEKPLQKPVNIMVGEFDEKEYLVLIKHNPRNTNWIDSKDYEFILSKEAYEELKEKGMTGERLWNSTRISIYEKSKFHSKYL